MTVQIALLRGINLGPSRRVPMADLRALLAEAGYGSVRTLLQSGNVVLESDAPPAELASELEVRLAERFGSEIPVLVRTREELAKVIARDPFGERATDPRRYQVTFLAGEPPAELLARAQAVAQAGEEVAIAGREIYAWHPAGIARSDLASLLANRRLGVLATARNWSTVNALAELARDT